MTDSITRRISIWMRHLGKSRHKYRDQALIGTDQAHLCQNSNPSRWLETKYGIIVVLVGTVRVVNVD